MKILVVGTGSVGRRHIGNLLALGAQVRAFSHRLAEGAQAPALPEAVRPMRNLQEALEDNIDAVVVANRNDQHIPVALQAARRGKALFIEKPLSASMAGADALLQEVTERALPVEAGFTLRMHPNLQWVREFLASGRLGTLMHARAAVGQWLPDWRPGTDHRKGYGAWRTSGGGVILDLIHELDLVHWLLGRVAEVAAMRRQVPQLEIETEAIAQIGLRLDGGALVQVHLDYVRPGYGRTFEVVGTLGTLVWDYVNATVHWEARAQPPVLAHSAPGFQRNDMFRDHMAHFLTLLRDRRATPVSPLSDSVEVLRVAMACHRSAIERRFVRPSEIDENFRISESNS